MEATGRLGKDMTLPKEGLVSLVLRLGGLPPSAGASTSLLPLSSRYSG